MCIRDRAQVLSSDKPLYLLKGKFKTGGPATAVMAQGQNWVEWAMTPDCVVTLRATSPLPTALPDKPAPLKHFLAKLEAQGHVLVKMHKHKITKDREGAEAGEARTAAAGDTYKIAAVEPVALDPLARESGEPTLQSLAAFVDLGATKGSQLVQVVHRLEYNPTARNITCGYPGVHLVKTIRISAGQAIPLVTVPTAAGSRSGAATGSHTAGAAAA